MKQWLFNNIKNISGWHTNRKLLAFAIDDYGNVRLNNKEAALALGEQSGNRFDAYDTLETREDLEQLFEVLSSVNDGNGGTACFTPYTLPCNLDFEALAANGFQEYAYETLPVTFEKLSAKQPVAYEGAWALWQEGVSTGLLAPQFHGREHINLRHFHELLQKRDAKLLASLQHRSLAGLPPSRHAQVGWTAAFSFWDLAELDHHVDILQDGLHAFEQVFGYRAIAFTPPAQQLHPSLYPLLQQQGIKAIDRPFHYRQHLGYGKYQQQIDYMRWDAKVGMVKLVRNVVFEPTIRNTDHVGKAMQQIEAAFRWHKPAIISTHRVNFCGHIDPANRKKGLKDLKELLQKIVKRWPEVEFWNGGRLVNEISKFHAN